jgi:2-methylcitrate dehydratase PrpD
VGTMSKSFHAGKACENGLLAALLAQNSFTANESAIENAKGFAATASGECDAAAALAEPPLGWHILSNLFKIRRVLLHDTFNAGRHPRAAGEPGADQR